MKDYPFNISDLKLRNEWYRWTIVRCLIIPFLSSGIVVSLSLQLDNRDTFNYLLMSLIVSVIGFLLIYHFAYKKHGTKWLTFVLIAAPLGLLRASVDVLNLNSALVIFFYVVDILIFIYWYYLTFKLREINKKVRVGFIRSTEGYKHVMSVFEKISSVELLNIEVDTFLKGMGDRNLFNEEIVVTAYDERKKAILSLP